MKKIVISSFVVIILAACNNSSSTTEEPATTPTNVQNVNGNMPDTSTGAVLNSTPTIDSSRVKDSVRR